MNWKQKLLKTREQWYLNKYEAARDFCVPFPKPYSDKTANDCIRCVCDFLKFNGHYVNRINRQGQVRLETVQLANGASYKKANWTPGNTISNAADITATIFGKHLVIKCKKPNEKLSLEQLKEKQRIEAAGAMYIVVSDMTSFVEVYEQTFENPKIEI